MADAHFRVQVESDHLKRLAAARPIQAVAELIWNAVDADATRVDLEVDGDDIAMRSVTVRDNGTGIPRGLSGKPSAVLVNAAAAPDERHRSGRGGWGPSANPAAQPGGGVGFMCYSLCDTLCHSRAGKLGRPAPGTGRSVGSVGDF